MLKTNVWHCPWCHVVKSSPNEHERCLLCDGWMLTGPIPHGTYTPLTEQARHAAFAKLMSEGKVRQ